MEERSSSAVAARGDDLLDAKTAVMGPNVGTVLASDFDSVQNIDALTRSVPECDAGESLEDIITELYATRISEQDSEFADERKTESITSSPGDVDNLETDIVKPSLPNEDSKSQSVKENEADGSPEESCPLPEVKQALGTPPDEAVEQSSSPAENPCSSVVPDTAPTELDTTNEDSITQGQANKFKSLETTSPECSREMGRLRNTPQRLTGSAKKASPKKKGKLKNEQTKPAPETSPTSAGIQDLFSDDDDVPLSRRLKPPAKRTQAKRVQKQLAFEETPLSISPKRKSSGKSSIKQNGHQTSVNDLVVSPSLVDEQRTFPLDSIGKSDEVPLNDQEGLLSDDSTPLLLQSRPTSRKGKKPNKVLEKKQKSKTPKKNVSESLACTEPEAKKLSPPEDEETGSVPEKKQKLKTPKKNVSKKLAHTEPVVESPLPPEDELPEKASEKKQSLGTPKKGILKKRTHTEAAAQALSMEELPENGSKRQKLGQVLWKIKPCRPSPKKRGAGVKQPQSRAGPRSKTRGAREALVNGDRSDTTPEETETIKMETKSNEGEAQAEPSKVSSVQGDTNDSWELPRDNSNPCETAQHTSWNADMFVSADLQLRDTIRFGLRGRASTTEPAFLTIELPSLALHPNRAWRSHSARHGPTVVFGGCDPYKVLVNIGGGIKMPVHELSRAVHVTPSVHLTDIFDSVFSLK